MKETGQGGLRLDLCRLSVWEEKTSEMVKARLHLLEALADIQVSLKLLSSVED